MSFFFTANTGGPKKKSAINVATLHQLECTACSLNFAKVHSPKMQPHGSTEPLIYVLGTMPSDDADAAGQAFNDQAGKMIRSCLPASLKSSVRYNTLIRTHSTHKKGAQPHEIECCRPSIIADIEKTRPKVIFGFGEAVLKWATKRRGISAWRGRRTVVQVGTHVCWFYSFTDPQTLIDDVEAQAKKYKRRSPNNPLTTTYGHMFQLDIKHAASSIDTLPCAQIKDNVFENIHIITGSDGPNDIALIETHFQRFKKRGEAVGVDIETTALKPYTKDARILSIAIGNASATVAIALQHRESQWSSTEYQKVRTLIFEFLVRASIPKAAHNLTFELEWLAHEFGTNIVRDAGMDDTMAQAYCIDNRSSSEVLKLDSLCVQYFGINLKNYSKVNVKDLDNEPLNEVLLYNGGDAKYCAMLFDIQDKIILEANLSIIYEEQLRRIATMVHAQRLGLYVDIELANSYNGLLDKKLRDIESEIKAMPCVRQYTKTYGEFNAGSPNHVLLLLRDILKCDQIIVGTDARGKPIYSTQQEVLERVDEPIAQSVLEYRRNAKLKSTYIETVLPSKSRDEGGVLWDDGQLHPSWNTLFTDTGRLSCADPNAQNWPKRKDKWVRKIIVPPPNHWMVSLDYGQIEPRVLAMASQDKTWIDLLKNRYDIHMEWAKELAFEYPAIVGGKKFINDAGSMKKFRQATKSNFVLAGIYGAQPPSISRNMKIPLPSVEKVHTKFWNTFDGLKRWQNSVVEQYQKHGYVECLTGRRRYGPLDLNKILNTGIQGTASDIVVDAMSRLSEVADEEDRWHLQAILNIHDDLTFYIPDLLLEEEVVYIINMMLDVPYAFCTGIPIQVDVEWGANWFEMQELGQYFTDERP